MAGRLHQTPICGRAESMFHTRAVPHVHKAAQCPALSYRYAQQISDGLIRPQSPIHSVHFPRSKLCHHLTAAHPARNPLVNAEISAQRTLDGHVDWPIRCRHNVFSIFHIPQTNKVNTFKVISYHIIHFQSFLQKGSSNLINQNNLSDFSTNQSQFICQSLNVIISERYHPSVDLLRRFSCEDLIATPVQLYTQFTSEQFRRDIRY